METRLRYLRRFASNISPTPPYDIRDIVVYLRKRHDDFMITEARFQGMIPLLSGSPRLKAINIDSPDSVYNSGGAGE
jgi:hypothetical protein